MKTVHKSVLIWYSAEQMFRLVTDVASYPRFLPWCDRAAVLSDEGDRVTAEIGIAFGGIRQGFTTRNTHVPGREVHMELVDGPFSQLDGHWVFTPVGAAPRDLAGTSADPADAPAPGEGDNACRIDFELNYGFSNFALGALVGPVFDRIAGSFVDAFVKRADDVYGG